MLSGQTVSTIITAASGGAGIVLGGYALLIRARGASAEPRQVLRRLWDWMEWKKVQVDVPEDLAFDVRRVIRKENDDQTD